MVGIPTLKIKFGQEKKTAATSYPRAVSSPSQKSKGFLNCTWIQAFGVRNPSRSAMGDSGNLKSQLRHVRSEGSPLKAP